MRKIACKYSIDLIAVREVPDEATTEEIEQAGVEAGNEILGKIRAIENFDRIVPLDAQAIDWGLYQSVVQAAGVLSQALNAQPAEGEGLGAKNDTVDDPELPVDAVLLPGPSTVH